MEHFIFGVLNRYNILYQNNKFVLLAIFCINLNGITATIVR